MSEIFEYLAILATGLIGIYSFRDGMLKLQRAKDAKQQKQKNQKAA